MAELPAGMLSSEGLEPGDGETRRKMDYASDIKRAVTTREAAEYYGLQINRTGYICCPFHHEKTPSLKLYKNGSWHCFGCGKGGDVISFVQDYFGLTFPQAMEKLNDDFHLGLPINEKPTQRQQQDAARKAYERRKMVEAQKKAEEAAKSAYYEALDYYVAIDTVVRKLKPKTPDFPICDAWAEALKQLPVAEYKLEMAETKLYEAPGPPVM